jgi:hypothetical protein
VRINIAQQLMICYGSRLQGLTGLGSVDFCVAAAGSRMASTPNSWHMLRLHLSKRLTLSLLFLPPNCFVPQFFVIGHDCGHRSFSENKLLEDIVGTLAFMPLIYPFEPWRIKHNQHHAQTNK